MGGIRGKYFNDFSEAEIQIGYNSMIQELKVLPKVHPIKELFADAWIDFMLGKFSYDGATFVKERNPLTLFEVSAFIHDWRNFKGYVGKEIDNEFLCIMIALNYKPRLIIERWLFMRLTFLNVLRHKFLGNLINKSPNNLFKI
jgi:hypothetical protein